MGQNKERVEVNGFIFAENNDVENITIYNTSSNKGTITDSTGVFTIKVSLNDIIEVSALQFKTVSVTINEEVIKSRVLKILLAEHVNVLDAVLLSSGLTGDLLTDINNAKDVPVMNLSLGDLSGMEIHDDKAFDPKVSENALQSITNKGGLYNGVDFVKIAQLIFKRKKKKPSKRTTFDEVKPRDILDVYSRKYICETYNIPDDKLNAFIVYIEENGLNQDLLKDKYEIYLIDFLIKNSKLFLKSLDEKK